MDKNIEDLVDLASDIFNSVDDVERNHVEVIDRLDKTNELLERIASGISALAAIAGAPATPEELAEVSPQLARLFREGRVS